MADIEEFLVEDYKLKTDYLTKHFSRMLTRFNFFLTIGSALFLLSMDQAFDHAIFLSVLGTILSALWFFFAASDNYNADVYRKQILDLHKVIMSDASGNADSRPLRHVGYTPRWGSAESEAVVEDKGGIARWLTRKYFGLGATEVPPIIAFFFGAIWIARGAYAALCQ